MRLVWRGSEWWVVPLMLPTDIRCVHLTPRQSRHRIVRSLPSANHNFLGFDRTGPASLWTLLWSGEVACQCRPSSTAILEALHIVAFQHGQRPNIVRGLDVFVTHARFGIPLLVKGNGVERYTEYF